MKRNLNRAWCAAAASLVAITSILNADYDDAQLRNLENRVSALEQRRGSNGMINPNGRIQVNNSYDVFFSADVLYWEAHENGLEFAVKNGATGASITDGQFKNIDFDWDWGCRLGVGYYPPHDGWDLYFKWLHFNTSGEGDVTPEFGGIIYPSLAAPSGAPSTTATLTTLEASSHWRLRLNQLDLELGREFYVSKWLTLRPHVGLRADFIHQKWKNHYKGGTVVQNSQKDELSWKNRFKGIGPDFGVNTSWGLGQGWSLFGDLDLSLLWGFFVTKEEEELENPRVVLYENRNHYHITRAVTDIAVGARYDYYFYGDRYHIRFQLGWENHIYFGQNQFFKPVDRAAAGGFISNLGDLTLQGWTFDTRFDF